MHRVNSQPPSFIARNSIVGRGLAEVERDYLAYKSGRFLKLHRVNLEMQPFLP